MWPKRLLTWAACAGMIAFGLGAAPSASGDGEFQWEESLESAQRLARKSHRLVLIHFGGPWCPPCQRMEQEVFSKPGFGSELAVHYVAVKIDPQRDPATAKRFGVQKVPSDVITTASGQMVYIFSPSPNTAAEYVRSMNGVAVKSGLTEDFLVGGPGAKLPAPPAVTPSPSTPPTGTPSSDLASPSTVSAPVSGPPPARPEAATLAAKPNNTDESDPPTRKASRQDREATDAPRSPSSVASAEPPAKPRTRPPSPMRQTAAARSQEPTVTQPPRPAAKKMPTALDGFCPVTLITRHKWQAGDRHWGAYHRGHLYLFAGEAEQKAFLDAPDDYTPAFNGLDPVLAVDRNEKVAGKREFGAFHRQRVYLFSSQETFHRFERDVARYTGETRQARRSASGTPSTSTAQNPPRAR